MRHLTVLFGTLLFATSAVVMAQEDDMYFSPKRSSKTTKTVKTEPRVRKIEVVYDDDEPTTVSTSRVVATQPLSETRDVDEYNRRGRSSLHSADTTSNTVPQGDTRNSVTYELTSNSLYDLGYEEGYSQGFADAEDADFYYGMRLARFHGSRFYAPWYWNSVAYVYDPWHWDPWYWDSWYRPYYYGGWYSVGWGIGHHWGGGYWGGYWNPYWPGYYPHHGHYPHWGHAARPWNGPRVSTVRNRDYGRTRIIDRSTRIGDSRRSTDRSYRSNFGDRITNRNYDRTSRFNDRSASRANRVTDRSGSRIIDRSSNGTQVSRTATRPSRTTSEGVTNRSSERTVTRPSSSHNSSSSRSGGFPSSSSSSRGGGGGFGSGSGGGGGRVIGGSHGGGGRGR